MDLRLCLNEVTYFDLIRELGKLFQEKTHRLNKLFSNELFRHIGFRILKSRYAECKLYGGILTLKYSLEDQGVRILNIL